MKLISRKNNKNGSRLGLLLFFLIFIVSFSLFSDSAQALVPSWGGSAYMSYPPDSRWTEWVRDPGSVTTGSLTPINCPNYTQVGTPSNIYDLDFNTAYGIDTSLPTAGTCSFILLVETTFPQAVSVNEIDVAATARNTNATANVTVSTYSGGVWAPFPNLNNASIGTGTTIRNLWPYGTLPAIQNVTRVRFRMPISYSTVGSVFTFNLAEFRVWGPGALGSITPPPTLTYYGSQGGPNLGQNITIKRGEPLDLNWSTTDADSCTASLGWSGSVGTSGTRPVSPLVDTNYAIHCTGLGGYIDGLITVDVKQPCALPWVGSIDHGAFVDAFSASSVPCGGDCNNIKQIRTCNDGTLTGSYANQSCIPLVCPPVTLSFNANPGMITVGGTANLIWNVQNATSCVGSGGDWTAGNKPFSNGTHSEPVSPTSDQTYFMDCSNSVGTANEQAPLTVTAAPVITPTLTFSASPSIIIQGQPTVLSWTVQNADGCNAFDGDGGDWPDGSRDFTNGTHFWSAVSPLITHTYGLDCWKNGGGGVTEYAPVIVNAPSKTLTTSLTAVPGGCIGCPSITSTLTGTRTGGTATGNITYEFDCTNDGTYEYTTTTAATSQTYSCTYTSSATARVRMAQEGVSSESTTTIAILASVCGNGTIEGSEVCDDGASNGACPATCSASCTTNSCSVNSGNWKEVAP